MFFKDATTAKMEVISVVTKLNSSIQTNKFFITPTTKVKFLAHTYRFVYCVDMSPSQSAVNIQKGEILFDEIVHCLKISLEGLCKQVN